MSRPFNFNMPQRKRAENLQKSRESVAAARAAVPPGVGRWMMSPFLDTQQHYVVGVQAVCGALASAREAYWNENLTTERRCHRCETEARKREDPEAFEAVEERKICACGKRLLKANRKRGLCNDCLKSGLF